MYPLVNLNADKMNSQMMRSAENKPMKVESLAAEHEAEVMQLPGRAAQPYLRAVWVHPQQRILSALTIAAPFTPAATKRANFKAWL